MSNTAAQIEALRREKQAYEEAGDASGAAAVDESIAYLAGLLEEEVPDELTEVDVALVVAARELDALRVEAESYRRAKNEDNARLVDKEIARVLKEYPVLDESKTKTKGKAPRPEQGEQESAVPSDAPERAVPAKPTQR